MVVIPTLSVPYQIINVILGQQAAVVTLRQLATGLYMDLELGVREIVGLVVCENLNRIVRNRYLGFDGDLFFLDNTGLGADPDFTGLGSRFSLMYASEDELVEPFEGS